MSIGASLVDWISGRDGNEFTGYAIAYNVVTTQDTLMRPGSVANVGAFLRSGSILISHRLDLVEVAYPVEAVDSEVGLWIRCKWHQTQLARECRTVIRARMAAGLTSGLSAGFTRQDDYMTFEDGKPIIAIRSVELNEVSLCPNPANPGAIILRA